MKILLVNWLDRANPQGGGAEIHVFELFSRLAAWGHSVRLVCSGWKDGPAREVSLNHPTHVAFDDQGRMLLSA